MVVVGHIIDIDGCSTRYELGVLLLHARKRRRAKLDDIRGSVQGEVTVAPVGESAPMRLRC